jgi:hypothetical protein
MQTDASNRSERAEARPVCSEPAIGWEPMNSAEAVLKYRAQFGTDTRLDAAHIGNKYAISEV